MSTHRDEFGHETCQCAVCHPDAVRQVLAESVEMLGEQIAGLRAQRAELIVEVETMRARLGAWRETARKGVRLVEHITVTQSTDGKWGEIHELYEMFDELHDAEIDAEFAEIDAREFLRGPGVMAQQARAKAARS